MPYNTAEQVIAAIKKELDGTGSSTEALAGSAQRIVDIVNEYTATDPDEIDTTDADDGELVEDDEDDDGTTVDTEQEESDYKQDHPDDVDDDEDE
jgi:hypothetical protein